MHLLFALTSALINCCSPNPKCVSDRETTENIALCLLVPIENLWPSLLMYLHRKFLQLVFFNFRELAT